MIWLNWCKTKNTLEYFFSVGHRIRHYV